MTPILHEADVTSIGNYGLGALKDALSCTVSCEENGAYDLTLIYPMTGLHAELLAERRLISAAPSRYENRRAWIEMYLPDDAAHRRQDPGLCASHLV